MHVQFVEAEIKLAIMNISNEDAVFVFAKDCEYEKTPRNRFNLCGIVVLCS